MSSRIPIRRTRSTRPAVTKDIENANAKPSTRLRSVTQAAENADPPASRATAGTASSMAKAIEAQGKIAGKRKREVLAEVTEVNKTKSKKSAKDGPLLYRESCPKSNHSKASSSSSEVAQQPPTTVFTFESSPRKSRQQDDATDQPVAKKRHLIPSDDEALSELPVADFLSSDAVEIEGVANQLNQIEEEDEDITGLWDDIDAEDMEDPLMVAEYVAEVCSYWKEVEAQNKYTPNANYMDAHPELNWGIRGDLLDWVMSIHNGCPFNAESFFLCANIFDRFMSAKPQLSVSKLYLVALTCFLIAAKFEETVVPSLAQLAEWAENKYDVQQIAKSEKYILRALNWDLNYPGPMSWLRRGSRADDLDPYTRGYAKYLLEVGVMQWRLLTTAPSLLAAAALWLGRLVLGKEDWNPTLIHFTTYREREIIPVANLMLTYIAQPPQNIHKTLFKKFAGKSHLKASVRMRQWTLARWEEGAVIDIAAVLGQIKEEIYDTRIARLEREQAQLSDE
ncbi:nime/cyclinb [Mycena floridula]|nr:nime/cyclinb [Mycena floridula]